MLASFEWPSVDSTTIGRVVLSASSTALVVSVPAGSIAWRYQPLTVSQPPGSLSLVRSRQPWICSWNCATVSGA